MVVHPQKSSFGEMIADLCVAPGQRIKRKNMQQLPLFEIMGGTVGKTKDFP